MPYISVKVTEDINPQAEKAIKEGLGKAIAIIPGKNESWLMLDIASNCKMYFKGDNSKPCAFAEVKLLGAGTKESYSNMTGALCELFEKVLGIPKDRTYVKYEECTHWGWNGSNF